MKIHGTKEEVQIVAEKRLQDLNAMRIAASYLMNEPNVLWVPKPDFGSGVEVATSLVWKIQIERRKGLTGNYFISSATIIA